MAHLRISGSTALRKPLPAARGRARAADDALVAVAGDVELVGEVGGEAAYLVGLHREAAVVDAVAVGDRADRRPNASSPEPLGSS